MWFFKQARQVTQVSHRETTEKLEPVMQRLKPAETRSAPAESIQQKAEPVMQKAEPERTAQTVADTRMPDSAWFVDVINPFESKSQEVRDESIEYLMDKNGWWKEE